MIYGTVNLSRHVYSTKSVLNLFNSFKTFASFLDLSFEGNNLYYKVLSSCLI